MGRKVRICHIASGDLWAGAEVQVFNILVGLKKLDEFELYAIIMNRGRLYEELLGLGMKVYLLDETIISFAKQIFKARAFIKENKINIIHSHRYKENILSGILNNLIWNKCKLFKTQHGSFDITSSRQMMIYRSIDLFITKFFFKKIIAVSSDISNEFARFLPREKIAIIHNSIYPEKYTISQQIDKNCNNDKFLRIGIVGRLVKIKNISEFIRIASDLYNSGIAINAYIAGDGPEMENLHKMVKDLGAKEYINFLGNIDDISFLYNRIDILFITSIHEGIPTVLLEAMYFGKIIIAHKVGGIPEIIKHNYNGFLYENIDNAKKIVTMVWKKINWLNSIRLCARKDILSKYTNIVQAKNYAKEYIMSFK